MKKLVLMVLVVAMSGCTSIYFDNGKDGREASFENEQKERWHHNVVFDLVEVSQPVDLQSECQGGEWASVKTEKTFLNGLGSFFANLYAPIWYPKTVTIVCK